jgi:hypothetical protein
MPNNQQNDLTMPGAHWFASTSMFCAGSVVPAAKRIARATKTDPAASGGPIRGGKP